MEHRIVELPAFVMGGFAKQFTPETAPEIAGFWESHSPRLAELAPEDNKICYGLSYDHKMADTEGGPSFGYLIGVDVSRDATLPDDATRKEIPASKYAVWTYEGHIKDFGAWIHKIWSEAMPAAGLARAEGGYDFERYDERWKPETGPLDYYIAVELT